MDNKRYGRQRPVKLVKKDDSENLKKKVLPLEVIEEKAEENEKNVLWNSVNPVATSIRPFFSDYNNCWYIIVIIVVALVLLCLSCNPY